jgi:hypothetical protein
MNTATKLNYLYCINKQCEASIYHRMVVLPVPFTNSVSNNYYCQCCKSQLISAGKIAAKALTPASRTFLSN